MRERYRTDINRSDKYAIFATALKNFFGSPCEELTADEDNEVFDDTKSRRFSQRMNLPTKVKILRSLEYLRSELTYQETYDKNFMPSNRMLQLMPELASKINKILDCTQAT